MKLPATPPSSGRGRRGRAAARPPLLATVALLLVLALASLSAVTAQQQPPAAKSLDPSFSVPAMQWQRLNPPAGTPMPGGRRDAVFVYDHTTKKIVLFGGRTRDNVPQDDTWLLDIVTGTWQLVENNPSRPLRPPARYAAVAGTDIPTTSDRQGVVIATGMGPNGQMLNDAWGFHMNLLSWNIIPAAGDVPPGMYNAAGGVSPEEHTIAPFPTTLYAALGTTKTGGVTDTYALTITGGTTGFNYSNVKAEWKKVDGGTARPPARSDLGGLVLSGEKLLAFGGCTASACPAADGWVGTPSNVKFSSGGVWKQVDSCPAPRRGASLAIRPDLNANNYQKQAVMFGGAGDRDAPGLVSYFDGDSNSWVNVLPDAVGGSYPAQRDGASMAAHHENGAVVMFGGQLADGSVSNEVWLLQFNARDNKNTYVPCFVSQDSTQRTVHGILMAAATALLTAATFVSRYCKPAPAPGARPAGARGAAKKQPPGGARNAPPVAGAARPRGGAPGSGVSTAGPQNVGALETPGRQVWLWAHGLLAFFGVACAGAGFYFAYSARGGTAGHFTSPHAVVGIVVLGLLALQALSGLVQPANFPSLMAAEREAAARRGTGVAGGAGQGGAGARNTALNNALRQMNVNPNQFSGGAGGPASAAAAGGAGNGAKSARRSGPGIRGFSYVQFWSRVHQTLGLGTLYLMYLNVFLGLDKLGASWVWFVVVAGVLGLLACAFIVLTLMGKPNRRTWSVRMARKLLRKKDGVATGSALPGPGGVGGGASSVALRGPIDDDDEDDEDDDEYDNEYRSGGGGGGGPGGMHRHHPGGNANNPTGTFQRSNRNGGALGHHGSDGSLGRHDDEGGDMYDREVVIMTIPKPKLRIVNSDPNEPTAVATATATTNPPSSSLNDSGTTGIPPSSPPKDGGGDPNGDPAQLPELAHDATTMGSGNGVTFGGAAPAAMAMDAHAARVHRSCCNLRKEINEGNAVVDVTPSPLSYRVDYESLEYRSRFAGHSISGRHNPHDPETPAPNAYQSPAQLGDGVPKWSIANKFIVLHDSHPGPSDYSPESLRVRSKAPEYSMRRKTGPPLFFTKENPPGCNEYHPKLEPSQVAATVKGRYKETKIIKTPGPANYLIPSGVPTGPQFSMVGRGEFLPEDDPAYWTEPGPAVPPGPSSYSPNAKATLTHAPTYSLGTRYAMPAPHDVSPGPAYRPTIGTIAKNDGPRVALKSRHPERRKHLPGPADYAPSAPVTVRDLVHQLQQRKAGAAAIQSRRKAELAAAAAAMEAAAAAAAAAEQQQQLAPPPRRRVSHPTPGPADYDTRPAHRMQYASPPKYSLSSRPVGRDGVPVGGVGSGNGAGPAPNAYVPSSDSFRKVPGPKAASMKGRLGDNVMVFPSLRLDTLRINV
ncbi:hypothetical protein H9P43_009625 [Blastocladiella emersonii ATCC 22665]|nr:hypothetical protein H9P43_009625 [Blastocladiella emersonii ATCC 22665]